MRHLQKTGEISTQFNIFLYSDGCVGTLFCLDRRWHLYLITCYHFLLKEHNCSSAWSLFMNELSKSDMTKAAYFLKSNDFFAFMHLSSHSHSYYCDTIKNGNVTKLKKKKRIGHVISAHSSKYILWISFESDAIILNKIG